MGFSDGPLYLTLLEITATVSTISLFLCGIPICLEIKRRKCTEEITSLPFLMGFIGSTFWLRYGMLVGEAAIIVVNLIGSLLMFSYLVFYIRYTKYRLCIILQVIAEIVAIDVMCVLVDFFKCLTIDDCPTKDLLGLCCMFFNIVTFGAPLAGIALVIEKKCCDTLPLPLCLANLIVASQWCVFGLLKHDFYIIIPNTAGIVLALMQISLFLVFPRAIGNPSPLSRCFGCARVEDLERNHSQHIAESQKAGSDVLLPLAEWARNSCVLLCKCLTCRGKTSFVIHAVSRAELKRAF
uniref:Sugar transporter SWEET n=1 Tax=Ditylenchus dipsaci TaxID=166011 RepID=A0A915D838_9BILA